MVEHKFLFLCDFCHWCDYHDYHYDHRLGNDLKRFDKSMMTNEELTVDLHSSQSTQIKVVEMKENRTGSIDRSCFHLFVRKLIFLLFRLKTKTCFTNDDEK